ncbi:MAG: PfkB family carbohydrate kinase [Bacteroidales bacterium]|nr:PfkB family carbohydrate kinase [Bacteroidales bacterium]
MEKKHDLCCVGHITLDKVVTPKNTVHMPGGTAFYFTHAIKNLKGIDYKLITAVGENEHSVVEELRSEGINVSAMPSKYSHFFENIYGENQDNRTQNVLAKADPFTIESVKDVEANIIHLGSLMADDFSLDVLKYVASKSKVSVDSQGYLREVRGKKVYPIDWTEKLEALKHIHFLKANELEMEVLTGYNDVKSAAKQLYDWGVKEVLITLGSLGSVIYAGGDEYIRIPAYKPKEVVDATGCGDTYMTGYLYKRALGESLEQAGRFAAAISSLKIENIGPFKGSYQDIINVMENSEEKYPEI